MFSIDGDSSASATVAMQSAPCLAGKWYILSAYIGIHRGRAKLTARCHFKDGGYKDFNSEDIIGYSFNGGLGGYTKRAFVKFKAPSDTARITPIFWVIANSNESNKHLRAARPMLEECTEYTTEPSPWQNAGVTAIHGGSIVTRTITTEQLAANSVTANEIATGAVTAKHVAANSIGANHVATRSLTADKLNVTSLSAISANLGDITGGSININNRFKVSNQGKVEMRANQGNVGLVITNENILVFDEKGNLMIKIGKI